MIKFDFAFLCKRRRTRGKRKIKRCGKRCRLGAERENKSGKDDARWLRHRFIVAVKISLRPTQMARHGRCCRRRINERQRHCLSWQMCMNAREPQRENQSAKKYDGNFLYHGKKPNGFVCIRALFRMTWLAQPAQAPIHEMRERDGKCAGRRRPRFEIFRQRQMPRENDGKTRCQQKQRM